MDCIFNSEITEKEIAVCIRALNTLQSPGQDGIPPAFFKQTSDTLMPIMVRLFNRMFANGEFPSSWDVCDYCTNKLKKEYQKYPVNYSDFLLFDILDKLCVYKRLKSNFEVEPYLSILISRKHRRYFAQTRTGVHNLEKEVWRYSGVSKHERRCKVFSLQEIEDEKHFF